ncbi:hypothetical protein EDB92DRAFT_588750 [Lactarius akahatsu]|uniref:C2H2-type domain-containing protein n=1 Tax=Lactarius akahatsu TaxID=416441 RepID=A0AAD4LIH5_9AGAM|nr:hypothetical protein EDB92DRAFT_588750 [Lactarius akahatsu]
MSSLPPDGGPPFEAPAPTLYLPPSQVPFEVHPQNAIPVFYFDSEGHILYMLPQGLGQLHDGANTTQPPESLVHPGNAPQFPPPEAAQSADLVTEVQAVEAPGGGDDGALPLCETCNLRFGRPQELKRHMDQTHQPSRQCPFNPCAYKWKRPNKIKAHIINEHRNELCPEVFQTVSALRGKRVVEFVDAYELGYNFKTPTEPYVAFSLPPLAPSENFMLSEYCGCCLGSGDVFSSEGVVVQTVEESTVLLEGM